MADMNAILVDRNGICLAKVLFQTGVILKKLMLWLKCDACLMSRNYLHFCAEYLNHVNNLISSYSRIKMVS